ncbi:M48 family metallopeptidase [Rubellicoccus peritrichatus]|uniref:M48 family metallopeptidase n=1 Tax=Rubellicoccus peritrichatus TaxID=3080537 RepID=A0AAQ3QXC3_9BACT|nr:M48 family metallopeptidase [Puniceicoccus sp. CR14]WOO43533.1 M48 family metallopeptidase [Puniceicoccus sp. CR14]
MIGVRKPSCIALVFIGLAVFFTACSTVHETGRKQFSLISESAVESMAAQGFEQLKNDTKISHDPEKNAQLQRVGKRIVDAARARGADLPPANQWEFVVFEDEAVNAFAMPGGRVGFYTGIFPLFDNDDDLAVVMGHEIAHVSAKHGQERVSQQMAAQVAGLGLALGLGLSETDNTTSQIAMAAFGAGASVGVLLPFSRSSESEADHIGLIYSSAAGYDPRRSIVLWQRMADQGGPRPPEFLSTHPSEHTRIRRLNQLIPQVMPIYERTQNDFSDYSILGPVYPDHLYSFYRSQAN